MGILVNKIAQGQFSLRLFQFSLLSVDPKLIHSHRHCVNLATESVVKYDA